MTLDVAKEGCLFDGCSRGASALGLCGGHYQQARRGKPLTHLRTRGDTPEQRFAEKVQRGRPEECWRWMGAVNSSGYGSFRSRGVTFGAHRYAWESANGPIPDGLTVDHRCYSPTCVNPGHMRLLTNSENASLQRSSFAQFCRNGHEYTPENTYYKPVRPGEGRRDCRACIRERVKRYKAKGRAA